MSSLILSLVAACTSPSSLPAPDTARVAARDDVLILSVGDVAVGNPVSFRVTGADNTNVAIVRGDPGGTSCPPGFLGACFDLLNVKLVTTVQADGNGLAITQSTLPKKAIKGVPVLGFQAMVSDALGVRTSKLVERVPVRPKKFAVPAGTNVLVVVLDDVGVDRMAMYGAPVAAKTPVIDSLAADGLVFEDAWSMPLCGPTRATIQTGLMPRRTGYGKNQSAESTVTELDPDFTTIAELVDHSPEFVYATSFLGKWHLVSAFSPSGPLGPKVQGWDFWTGTINAVDHWFGPKDAIKPDYYHVQLVDDSGHFVVSDEYATTRTTNDAIGRVGVMPEPWLMQVSYNASHEPWHVPPADLIHTPLGLTPDIAALHRAATEAADTELGRLLAAIPADVRERTMVFVLGDNGTPGPAAYPWENPDQTKATLFDGGIRVPFVVNGPLVKTPGSRSNVLAHVADLFPTIAEIAGVHLANLPNAADPDQALTVDGVSLVPVFDNPKAQVRSTIFAEEFNPGGGGPFAVDNRAARNDTYKLTVNMGCGTESFYEYTRGARDEGEDLLALGPLTVEQEAGRTALRAEMDAEWANLPYESDTWEDRDEDIVPRCDLDTGDTGMPADTNAPHDTNAAHDTNDSGVVAAAANNDAD